MPQQSLPEPQPEEDCALHDVPYRQIHRGVGLDDGQNSYGNKREVDIAIVLSILGEVLDLLDESLEDELFTLPAGDAPENDDDSVFQK
jgi:hypothetical protein